MIKVEIIGCGKQADAHAGPIRELPNCELVGVCDREELMAQQLKERFGAKQYFSDARKMLDAGRPDIVHIVTPPQGHLELGKLCLDAGCHVYFEKPFTLNAVQAAELLDIATVKGLKITVGHNNQFNHVSRRMRALIREGYLGGDAVHVESVWCYDLSDKIFAKALLGDKNHWVRKLPGKLLHNIISHGIGRITEFLKTDSPQVTAQGFRSDFLRRLNETEIIDELRVIISDSENTTAYFTFSSQIFPRIQQFRVYGPKRSLAIDDMRQTLICENSNYTYYLNHVVPSCLFAKQHVGNVLHSIRKFLHRDFHFESGRKVLIESFYRSIYEGTPLPISQREILLTARIMDSIFDQVYPA